MMEILDVVVCYIDPVSLCNFACVNRGCSKLVEWSRHVQKKNPKRWIGEADAANTVSIFDKHLENKYLLSTWDVFRNFEFNLFDLTVDFNQVTRYSFAKYGGPEAIRRIRQSNDVSSVLFQPVMLTQSEELLKEVMDFIETQTEDGEEQVCISELYYCYRLWTKKLRVFGQSDFYDIIRCMWGPPTWSPRAYAGSAVWTDKQLIFW